MNDNAKLWVQALRSGEYNQATGMLRKEGGYCCLGVACQLYHEVTGLGEWIMLDERGSDESSQKEYEGFEASNDFRTYRDGAVLPEPVRDWLGLSDHAGWADAEFPGFALEAALTTVNDNGATLAQIADIIESEPDGLFRALEAA